MIDQLDKDMADTPPLTVFDDAGKRSSIVVHRHAFCDIFQWAGGWKDAPDNMVFLLDSLLAADWHAANSTAGDIHLIHEEHTSCEGEA